MGACVHSSYGKDSTIDASNPDIHVCTECGMEFFSLKELRRRRKGGMMGDHKLNIELLPERRAANFLKDHIVDCIQRGVMTKKQLQEKLDLLPAGVDNLLEVQWDLEKAIRVSLLLNQEVNLSLVPEP